jgi:hypothetical protein
MLEFLGEFIKFVYARVFKANSGLFVMKHIAENIHVPLDVIVLAIILILHNL